MRGGPVGPFGPGLQLQGSLLTLQGLTKIGFTIIINYIYYILQYLDYVVIREDERRREHCNLRLSYTQCVSKVRSRVEKDLSRQK